MIKFKDMSGQEINSGDYVVYAMGARSTGYLVYAIIEEIKESKPRYNGIPGKKIKLRKIEKGDIDQGGRPKSPPTISKSTTTLDGYTGRFLKINVNQFPQDIQEMLNEVQNAQS